MFTLKITYSQTCKKTLTPLYLQIHFNTVNLNNVFKYRLIGNNVEIILKQLEKFKFDLRFTYMCKYITAGSHYYSIDQDSLNGVQLTDTFEVDLKKHA